MNSILENLKEKFDSILRATNGGKMQNARINNSNELYFEIDKKNIIEIAYYIYEVLNYPLVTIVATDDRKTTKSYTVRYFFSDDKRNQYIALQTKIDENDLTFPSITPHIHEASWYEREIKDMFGLVPLGHPDPKRIAMHENWPADIYPLRKDFSWNKRVPIAHEKFEFYRMEGEGVFEIAVGPVHAGIIEPGHFRFSVAGERVLYLEPRLYYKHKGTEKLFESQDAFNAIKLAERISGDTSFTHALCYVEAIEKACGITIPDNAKYIRMVLSELERIYNHFSDCGFIATDTGYSFGGAQGTRLKEKVMQLNEKLTGSRFLRGVNAIGGVNININKEKRDLIKKEIKSLIDDFKEIVAIERCSSSLMDRLETAGILDAKIAKDHGTLGVPARASGINRDNRITHPYEKYSEMKFNVPVLTESDVYSRFKIRVEEIYSSAEIIEQALAKITDNGKNKTEIITLPADKSAINTVESWRGEIAYYIETGDNNTLNRCKVRDASFHNWAALPHAVKGNIVPDFPLVNKSFNLSYSGNDL